MLLNNEVQTIIKGEMDRFDLRKFHLGTFWFKLSNLPIRDSLILQFDGQDWKITTRYKIVIIASTDTLETTINGITYLPYTSMQADSYAASMIGESFYKKGYVEITKDNYLQHKYHMIGRVFIDFSESEQIRNVLDSVDLDGSRTCSEFSATYFYEVK